MKVVVTTLTSWTTVPRCAGKQPQWCVSRIFKTCRRKSRARLTRFEQYQNEGWTFLHASGNRCLHDTGSPGLLEKQQRRQLRQQQSNVNTSKGKVHLREERDPQGAQNLDFNSWMPEMQEGFIWDSHLQVCHKYGSTPWPKWTRNRWSEALGWCTLSIERKIPQSTGEEFTDEDWPHCLYLGRIKTRFEICKDENGELRYIRAIQGQSGGMIISPRLMNYVMIPHEWKRFIYHVGRARDQYSIAENGLVAGGMERKEGRQTIFFTPLPIQQWCRRSRINDRCYEAKKSIKFIGDLNKMQCTGFICPQHKMLV